MEEQEPSAVARGLRQHADRTPDRLAVWDDHRRLTYAELDALVGTLALTIAERARDVGEMGVLPLLVDRGVPSVIAINAAIRAGQAFTPIDAHIPAAALDQLLERLGRPAIVVDAADRPIRQPPGVEVVPVPAVPGAGVEPLPVDLTATARVLFTSGSSGEPKGVVNDWYCLDAYVGSPLITPPPDIADFRGLCISPMSFSAGVWSAMRPSVGASVRIVDPNAHDPVELLEICDADRLTALTLIPSQIRPVIERWPQARRLENVRTITAFGEPLEWPMVEIMRRLVPDSAAVVNAFGATEGTLPTFAMRIDSGMPIGRGRVPLGRALDPGRLRFEPLDVDEGDVSQVIGRGRALATGYWRDPEQTARVFGREPDGTPFWRSGDLVRVDADGLYHFVGRVDNVVKINGKLVEPSEPERVIGSIPGIRRTVVLVQPTPRGGKRLVAHVEVDDDAAVTPSVVRTTVAAQVAPHLVPAVIVRHDRLPVTGRGKVDRQALIAAELVPWREPSPDRPVVTFELAVLDVVGEIVGHRGLGPDDDLWDAGLDSLGATELLSALQDFGWPAMPESVLLEHRTAASLNAMRNAFVPNGDTIWLGSDSTGDPVICVLPPSSDPLTFRRFAQELGAAHPVGIVRQFDPASADSVPGVVGDIAEEVVAKVRPTVGDRRVTVVGYSASGVVAYEVARLLQQDGTSARVVLLDAPAGAVTAGRRRVAAPGVARRMRSVARQAWLRALPPAAMPQRERAFARYELAARAAQRHVPTPSDVPVALFCATNGGIASLVEAWSQVTTDLTVVDLDCDHTTILDQPAIGEVARWVREASGRS